MKKIEDNSKYPDDFYGSETDEITDLLNSSLSDAVATWAYNRGLHWMDKDDIDHLNTILEWASDFEEPDLPADVADSIYTLNTIFSG